jgi:hypothetical protein
MNWDERKEKIRGGELLEVIREKPALYLGERSLSALWYYLQGYWMALSVYDLRTAYPLPPDFHDWVAYRLHFYESTSGYRNMILKRVPEESAALDRFFELLDEHKNRRPHIVAQVPGGKEYTWSTVKEGRPQEQQTGTYPTLNLIAYTDDPGFFVSSDDADADFPRKDHFFPTLQWFGRRFGISKDDVAILDASTFNRWVSEENRFPQRGQKSEPSA